MKTLGYFLRCNRVSISPALCAITTLLLVACARGYSQGVPALVNYQGRLSNPDGSPLPTADYTLTFNVFDAATNGALVWGPQIFDNTNGAAGQGHALRVPVVQGYFNVMLGPVDTAGRSLADAFSNATRYVEIAVSNLPPIAPRQQILTTPFAFQSANSAKLAGFDWSALLGINNPETGKIPFAKLASPQIGTSVGIGGIAISASCGDWTSPDAVTPTVIPNFTLTITTKGNPAYGNTGLVEVTFVPVADFVDQPANFHGTRDGTTSFLIRLLRDGVIVGLADAEGKGLTSPGEVEHPPSAFRFLDLAPAGTHTYSVQMYANPSGSPLVRAQWTRMVVREL